VSADGSAVLQRIRDRLQRRVHGRDGDAERGVSLVELMVSMALLAFVSAIFMAGINGVVLNVGKQGGLSDGQTQARKVYSLFDKTVRQANGITVSAAGTVVSFDYNGPNGTAVADNCVKWQYVAATGLLQYHKWQLPAVEPTTWTTAATNVVPLGSANIFAVTAPASAINEGLVVTFGVAQGKPQTTARSTTTFNAENSTLTSSSSC
jgi:prepilin-type N-terminal cleavage/methylation domain-containing protein